MLLDAQHRKEEPHEGVHEKNTTCLLTIAVFAPTPGKIIVQGLVLNTVL